MAYYYERYSENMKDKQSHGAVKNVQGVRKVVRIFLFLKLALLLKTDTAGV